MATQLYNGKLIITVHAARDLNSKISMFNLDPQLFLSFNRIRQSSTIIHKGHTAPQFNNQKFEYTVNDCKSSAELVLEVRDTAWWRDPKPIGAWRMNIEQIAALSADRRWIQLIDSNSFTPAGQLEITIEWDGKVREATEADSAAVAVNPNHERHEGSNLRFCCKCLFSPIRMRGVY